MTDSPLTRAQDAWSFNRRVWTLTLPIIATNVTVPLLGLVDTAVVGHLDAGIRSQRLPVEQGEQLASHVEERHMLIAAWMLLEPHGHVEVAAPLEVLDTQRDE